MLNWKLSSTSGFYELLQKRENPIITEQLSSF